MKIVKTVLISLAVFLVVAQVIRIDKSNPPVDPARTMRAQLKMTVDKRGVFDRACRDCHSNETVWPWYSNVAPVSWLVGRDVKEGRRELNISDWARYDPKRADRKLKAICEQVKEGEMPIWFYTMIHPQAKLSNDDRQALCAWVGEARQQISAQNR